MNITYIVFPLLLVGLPASTGAYLVVAYFRSNKVSSGVSMLVFAIAVAGVIVYYLPEGPISSGKYLMITPLTLIIGTVVGAIAGFVTRRRNINS